MNLSTLRLLRTSPRMLAATCLTTGTLLLSGCATGPNANPQDPMEPWNRGVYKFNDAVDQAVLKPVATAYTTVTPTFVQKGVRNFFSNLGDAWSAVNSALQLKGQDAMNSFWRFTINSTFGLGGMFDVASEARIPQKKQDFGLTLGRWGVGSGPYMVLPLLGPSTLRDTVALPVDMKANPVGGIHDVGTRNSFTALGIVSQRAELMGTTNLLEQAALDPYSFMRDAYMQNREARIRDGQPAATPGQGAAMSSPRDDGYEPAPDAGTPATSTAAGQTFRASSPRAQPASAPDMDGYEPPPDGDNTPTAGSAPPQAPASASEHSGQTPYYAPDVPQLLNKINPGWGNNLWRK